MVRFVGLIGRGQLIRWRDRTAECQIRICLYATAKCYDHHAELKVVLEGNGDLSMEKIQLAMGEERPSVRLLCQHIHATSGRVMASDQAQYQL